MDETTYKPQKLNSNNLKLNKQLILNENLNINCQTIFPHLTQQPIKIENNQQSINWSNIIIDTDEPIKELEKKKQNKETQTTIINDIVETPNNKIIDKIKPTYTDETGWTHIVKSTKAKYKEKKKKIIDGIDDLIKNVIKK